MANVYKVSRTLHPQILQEGLANYAEGYGKICIDRRELRKAVAIQLEVVRVPEISIEALLILRAQRVDYRSRNRRRKMLELSQRKLPLSLGVDSGTLQSWEGGQHQPTSRT
jgi:hypothetical protein